MRFSFLQKNWFWLGVCLLGSLYIVIILVKANNFFAGDEGGYVEIANDLAKGQLSSVNWWGPGYPLIIAHFVRFQIPLIYAKLLNACFLIGTIVYLRSSLLLYLSEKYSTGIALIMGIYLPVFFYLHMIIREKFAVFLMS